MSKRLFQLLICLALPAGAHASCPDLLKLVHDARLITGVEADRARVLDASVLFEPGGSWFWSLADQQLESGRVTSRSAVVLKPSGFPIVIMDPNGRPSELVPVAGTRATVTAGGLSYTLDDEGLWRIKGAPPVEPPTSRFGPTATVERVARAGEPLLLWRRPVHGHGLTLTDLNGRTLFGDRSFDPGDVIEFADGRRLAKMNDGTFRELPPVGGTRAWAAEILADQPELARWILAARVAIENRLSELSFPTLLDILEGEAYAVSLPPSGSGYQAWAGREINGVRHVIVLDPQRGTFVFPDEFKVRGLPVPFRLRNCWLVTDRGGRWITTGGAAAAGVKVEPRPRRPAPSDGARAKVPVEHLEVLP